MGGIVVDIAYSAGASAGASGAGASVASVAGASVVAAGSWLSYPAALCSMAAGAFTRGPEVATELGMKKVERMANTQIAAARIQVTFSMKLLVRRTPMIWFEPANDDERPPPFDFWMSTTPIISRAAMRVRTIRRIYIA